MTAASAEDREYRTFYGRSDRYDPLIKQTVPAARSIHQRPSALVGANGSYDPPRAGLPPPMVSRNGADVPRIGLPPPVGSRNGADRPAQQRPQFKFTSLTMDPQPNPQRSMVTTIATVPSPMMKEKLKPDYVDNSMTSSAPLTECPTMRHMLQQFECAPHSTPGTTTERQGPPGYAATRHLRCCTGGRACIESKKLLHMTFEHMRGAKRPQYGKFWASMRGGKQHHGRHVHVDTTTGRYDTNGLTDIPTWKLVNINSEPHRVPVRQQRRVRTVDDDEYHGLFRLDLHRRGSLPAESFCAATCRAPQHAARRSIVSAPFDTRMRGACGSDEEWEEWSSWEAWSSSAREVEEHGDDGEIDDDDEDGMSTFLRRNCCPVDDRRELDTQSDTRLEVGCRHPKPASVAPSVFCNIDWASVSGEWPSEMRYWGLGNLMLLPCDTYSVDVLSSTYAPLVA